MNRSTTAWRTIDWVIVLGFFVLALKLETFGQVSVIDIQPDNCPQAS